MKPHSSAYLRPAFLGRPVFLLLAMVLGCHGNGVLPEQAAAPVRPARPVVRTEAAERRTIFQTVEGLGYCEGLPERTATLTAAVEGRVVKILAAQGATVKAGQPIVELDSAVAAANLAEKIAARDALEAGLPLLMALPRPEEQKSYQLAIEAAKLAVEKAEALVSRLRPLRERGEVSAQQLFEAELAVRQARLQQQTAESEFQVAMLGARREAIAEAKARIAAAAAAAATAASQLELYTVRAPIDGVLDSLSCRLGQTLAVGTAVGEIVDLSEVCVQVWIPAPDARLVRPGQAARVHVSGERNGRLGQSPSAADLAGRVAFVGRVVDPLTGNLPVRILVKNPLDRLALGQMAAATITVSEKTDVLAVPADAVEDLGGEPTLCVVREGKSVVLHPRRGARDKRWVEVIGTGLAEGEPVIVEGGYNLPDGSEVTVERAPREAKRAPNEPASGKSP